MSLLINHIPTHKNILCHVFELYPEHAVLFLKTTFYDHKPIQANQHVIDCLKTVLIYIWINILLVLYLLSSDLSLAR